MPSNGRSSAKSATPGGVDAGVFQQQQGVLGLADHALFVNLTLQVERLLVFDGAEPAESARLQVTAVRYYGGRAGEV